MMQCGERQGRTIQQGGVDHLIRKTCRREAPAANFKRLWSMRAGTHQPLSFANHGKTGLGHAVFQ